MEHEELNEARVSSRKAVFIAIASILLTLAGLGYQLFSTSRVEVVNTSEIYHTTSPDPAREQESRKVNDSESPQ
jgi:hypothetical protein